MSARLLLTCLLGTAAVAEAPPAVVFEKATIPDRQEQQPAALTALVPKGWKVQGGPKWYPTFVHQVSFELRVGNPAGDEQVEVFPTYWFTHSENNPFPPRPMTPYMGQVWLAPHDPVEMLEKVTVPGFRAAQRPRVTQREELKDLARGFARADGQAVKAGRVRVEYEARGRPVEEDFYIVLSYYQLKTAAGSILNWSPVVMPFAVRAARGKLDAASSTLLACAFSVQPTPAYYKAMRLAQTKFIGNMVLYQELDRQDARAIFKTRADIAEVYQNIWKEKSRADQRTFETRQDLLGGVAPYRGEGSTYLLPHTHKYQWASNDGTTVILTDDINYDPGIGSRVRWERLTGAKR
ncbi:MAG: hypothetical protein U0804_20465 [Gemmataceae bacterium]